MADEIFMKLSDFSHSRMRTELYLGSREEHTQVTLDYFEGELQLREHTWIPALYTAVREIIDNSLDEIVVHEHGDSIFITYDPDNMIISVADNGRGVPIHEIPALGKGPAASILLGESRAGRNFAEREDTAGMNGLGGAVVNFVSEWFTLDIWRDGQHFKQEWTEGKKKKEDIHKTNGPVITKGPKNKTGTQVTFKPSALVFHKMILPPDFIIARLWDIAVWNPKVKVFFNDKQLKPLSTKKPVEDTYFNDMKTGKFTIISEGLDATYYVVPAFNEAGHVHSIVNNIPTFQGGTHVEGFKNGFYTAIISELSKTRAVKKEELVIKRDDVANDLLICASLKLHKAKFDSQNKNFLISEISNIVKNVDIDQIQKFIKANPEWVESVLEHCRQRTNKKEASALDKTQKKLSRIRVGALKDATGKNRQECIIFIAEGDSAIGGIMDARNPKIHGGIGLRGKVLNVLDKKPQEVVANKVIVDIMASIGLQIGVPAKIDQLRYGKIYITTDEDEDGKNITALLVAFFYQYWKELFDPANPVIYKFSTPLIMAEKGNETKFVFANEYDQFKIDLDNGVYKGYKIVRAKGLARLKKKHWDECLKTPNLMAITDDGDLNDTLELIFRDGRENDRKRWLER